MLENLSLINGAKRQKRKPEGNPPKMSISVIHQIVFVSCLHDWKDIVTSCRNDKAALSCNGKADIP